MPTEGFLPVGVSGKLLNTVVVNQTDGTEVHNEVIDQGNIISTNNSRDAANLAADATWTGTGEEVGNYGRVGVSFVCDNAASGTLWFEVSHDGVNYSGPPRTVSNLSAAQPFMWNIVEKYFRIRFVNDGVEAQNLSIQTQYSNNIDIFLNHALDETLKDEYGALLTRAIIGGQTGGGVYKNVPVNERGRLMVNLPLTAFGELEVAENTPVFQTDFVYGGPHEQLHTETTQTSGTVTYSDNMAVCDSGETALGLAAITSKRFVKYRPGQGVKMRCTVLFDTPTAASIQAVGLSNGESGILLGYRFSSEVSVWRQYDGLREIQTLTVTTGSSTNEDITITLDGTAVSNVTVTNTGDASATAWEIAQHDFSQVADIGWRAYAEGDTVVFICEQTSPRTGTFSLSGATTAVGTFAETVNGAAPTVSTGNGNQILQSSFNHDVLDGTGSASNPSGLNVDWTKGQVIEIEYQYLGYGSIKMRIEDPMTGEFILFHDFHYSNANTIPNLGNPALVWSLSAYNFSGSGFGVTCKSASAAMYTQGRRVTPIAEYGQSAEIANASTGVRPVLSIRPKQVYGGKLNLTEGLVEEISVSFEGTKPNKVYIYIDGTLNNTADFQDVGGSSMMMVDSAATSVTGGIQKLARSVSKTGQVTITKETLGELFVNRNKLITVAVDVGANNTDVDASIAWAEDI